KLGDRLARGKPIVAKAKSNCRYTGKPCDLDGHSIPWMNYSIVRILKERLTDDLNVFEFGSGASTLFFSSRVAKIVSCEHDEKWYLTVRSSAPQNVSIVFEQERVDGRYCRVIKTRQGDFDLVVVDGRDRPNCVIQSKDKLTQKGVLLLDDSHREGYQSSIDFMHENGYRSLTLEGLKPLMKRVHSTTIFYRDGNCLGL
ncbi:MAG: hypothetical protein ABGX22_11340, partial [Pirellulaceae bacterium]